MPEWIRDEADYAYRLPGQSQDSRVRITGLMDFSESERPKMLLEDRWDNNGPSVQESPAARDECIKRLSTSMKMDPSDADWFTRDRDGKLQSVGIGYERSTQTDPEYTRLLNSGEFNQMNKEDSKRYFPDVAVSELHTSMKPADRGQQQELAEAFREAKPAQRADPEAANTGKSAHEYDLSQERHFER